MGHVLRRPNPNVDSLSDAELRHIVLNETLLREAQHMAGVGSWAWDIPTNSISWSDELYRHFGLDPDNFEATYEAFMECIHPDDRELVNDTVQAAFQDHQPWAFEHRIVRPDGEVRWVFGQGAVEVEDGEPVRMFGTETDITDQRALQQRAEIHTKWFEQSLDLLCITDGEGLFMELNPAWTKVLGWDMEDLIGHPFHEFIHPDDVEKTLQEADNLWADNDYETVGFENRYRTKDGDYRTLHWTSAVDPETGHLLAVARDVTDERHASARFQSLLDAAPDAIVLTDSKGAITYTNKQVTELFGYESSELHGKRVEILIPTRFHKSHPKHREDFHANPKTRPMGSGSNLTAQHKDGHEIPVEVSLAPLEVPEGRVVMAAIRDITDRKEAEKTQRLAFEQETKINQLEQSNEFRINLLNTVAHELNTPLTPLQLQAHILSQTFDEASPAQQRSLEILNRNLRRLKLLVSDILDMSRMQADRLDLRFAPFKLGTIIEETVETFAEAAVDAEVELIWTPADGLSIMADADRLTQVLYNLVGNAIKFTPPKGIVKIDVQNHEDTVEIRVSDTGLGITPEEADGLFQPFGQVHENQTQPGTGLGLFISKGIVESHGGTLTMESEGRNQGSTFTMRIPQHPTP